MKKPKNKRAQVLEHLKVVEKYIEEITPHRTTELPLKYLAADAFTQAVMLLGGKVELGGVGGPSLPLDEGERFAYRARIAENEARWKRKFDREDARMRAQ